MDIRGPLRPSGRFRRSERFALPPGRDGGRDSNDSDSA